MTSKVEELRGLVIYDLTEYYKTAAVNLGKQAESEAIEMADSLISAAHAEGVAEGAAEERERIRKTAQVWMTGDPPPNDTWYGVDKRELDPPVLAPQPERGKPSQALLDELSEICGGEVTHETTVLAPTKEGEK